MITKSVQRLKNWLGITLNHTVIACTDETKQRILQKQCLSCVFVCVWQKILRTLMCKIKNWVGYL